jgi:hypothetical protein
MWNRIAGRIATKWLLTERLMQRAAGGMMQVRTRGGLLVGQCPDDKRSGLWLGHLLGLSYQPEIVMDMKVTGSNKQSVYDGIYVGRPSNKPGPGTSYRKRGLWLVWNGTQWAKGSSPEDRQRDTAFRREEMGGPLTPEEMNQRRRRVQRQAALLRGERFKVKAAKLEDLTPGEWVVTRLATHEGKPTYVMQPFGGGRAVQHYAEHVDSLFG